MYLALLDIKIEKLRGKHNGVIDARTLKPTEVTNCNNYVRNGLAMFTHYISWFAPVHLPDGKTESPFARGGKFFVSFLLACSPFSICLPSLSLFSIV